MNPVDIVNLGLGWIGKDPIAALDNPVGKIAERVSAAFPGLRDAVLEDGDWTFAMERLALNRVAGAPLFGFSAWYDLPPRVLRVVTAQEPGGAPGAIDAFASKIYGPSNGLDWKKEGRRIVANTGAATLHVLAVVQTPDSALWSPEFCQALAARVAANLSQGITENRSLNADMWALYRELVGLARMNDGRQGRSEQRRANALAARRR